MKTLSLRFLSTIIVLFGSALSATAHAEPSTSLDRLSPAPAGDSFLGVPSAIVGDSLRPSFALLGSFASSPLRQYISRAGVPTTTRVLVSHQAFAHLLGSLEFAQRFKLDIDVPIALSQAGEASAPEVALGAPGSFGLGDLRLGARAGVAPQNGWIPAVAIALSVWLPTSNAGPYGGGSDARMAPTLLVGAEYPRFLWSVALSRRFQQPSARSIQRSDVTVAAAAAVRMGAFQLGPEFWFSEAVEGVALSARTRESGGELLLTGRYRSGPIVLSLGAGPGLGSAPGVPEYRILAGVSFAPEFSPKEELPAQASQEVQNNKTSDQLSIVDNPTLADRQSTTVDENMNEEKSSLPDQDGDGIPDSQDHCPTVVGVPSLDPLKNGCPSDRDNDGIPDNLDACPDEKGEASKDPSENGCPRSVRVQGEQIVILQQVNFKTASDIIDPGSYALLQQVADVILQHPDIARLAIDGHTDNQGNGVANLELSRRRAVAVLRWISERGVDARRLEARGFGAKQPIADNKTEAGRAKNRRVEFQILRRTSRGEAGWREGNLAP